MHQAIPEATGDVLVQVNPDTELLPGAFAKFEEARKRLERFCSVPRSCFPERP